MKYFLTTIGLVLLAACGKDPVVNPVTPPVNPVNPSVQIGTPGKADVMYSWSPSLGLSDPKAAQPMASPKKTTLYTVTTTSKCGVVSSSTYVHVYKNVNGQLVEILN